MEREKRAIRLQIARQRRRIERRLGTNGAGLSGLFGWSKQATRRPEATLLTAFGDGLAAGMGRTRSADWSDWALRIVRMIRFGRRLWREFLGRRRSAT